MGTTSGSGGNSRVDQATWDRLLGAYRADPGNHSNASRLAGVQRKTARRAYEHGYPERPWGARSIKDLLMDEQTLARARLQVEADREELESDRASLEADRFREEARVRSVQTREQEGKMVAATRVAVMNSLGAAMQLVGKDGGLQHAMQRMGSSLVAIALKDGDLSSKDVRELSGLLRRYASTLRELSQAGQTAMEMERLFLGEPTQMIGVTTDLDTAPLDELVKMAGYQDGVLRRAAERGLVILDGGRSGPPRQK